MMDDARKLVLRDHARKCLFLPDTEAIDELLDEVNALQARVAELEEWKRDVEDATNASMDERCDMSERHCTCVPLLRTRVRELEGALRPFADQMRGQPPGMMQYLVAPISAFENAARVLGDSKEDKP
jgi:hypothetical protein